MTGIRGAASILLLLSACSDDAAVEASETTGDAVDSSVGAEIGGADTSMTTPALESSGVDASSESSSSSDESRSTGEPEADIFEIVVSGVSPSDERGFFRYRRVDGVPEELVRLVDDSGAPTYEPLFFPDRRAVFSTDFTIWLAELDGDEDAATRLDVAPLSGGPYAEIAAIPDAEAIVVVNHADRSAYRVDVEGAVAAAPVLVAHDMLPPDGLRNGVVDPLGRWLMFDLDESRANVALAPLEVPDDDPIQITSEVAPASARYLGFLPDGGGLLYQELVDVGDIYDPATALYFVGLDGTSMAAPQLVRAIAAPDTMLHGWAPHPLGLGFAFVVGPEYGARDLWFCPVADGVAGAAMLVVEDAAVGPPTWSPDGTRLAVHAYDASDGSGGLALVSVVDGESGALVPVEMLPPAQKVWLRPLRFAPDGNWLYFEHEEGDEIEIVRVALTDEGWDDWQVVAADDVRELEDLSADGSTLLYRRFGGGVSMLAVDVSGAMPSVAVELGEPLPPDILNVAGRLTADGRFALLEQEVGAFGPDRLVLVDLAAPAEAEVVIEDVEIAQVVPQR